MPIISDKKDVLDPDLRLRFAWRTAAVLPDDLLSPPSPAAPPPPAEAPARTESESEQRQMSPGACMVLARRIARIWEMTPRARQAAATHRLLARLEPTNIGFMGMKEHPVEVMRLWRLGLRHAHVLGKGSRRILWSMPIILDGHEVLDFLVEVVEGGGENLFAFLEKANVPALVARWSPVLSARLIHIIEGGRTWKARERAVRWLVRVDRRAAVEPLRRALRTPLLRLRSCALSALLQTSPAALTEEDVAWLLEDAVKHPLPRGIDDEERAARAAYEAALLEAVKARPPSEGWRPVTTLLKGNGVPMGWLREGMDRDWAIRALAAGWPDRAAAWIDEILADSTAHLRGAAVEAAALLPEELARPRLLLAAELPDHEAAERAKGRWFARFGEACPVAPLAGVPVELLDAPPSDALLARLTVLRGSSDAAAGKILGAALAEAPSREALVLLLYSLRCLGRAHEQASLAAFDDMHFVARLIRGKEVWADALLRSFGEPALDGLLALAKREARGRHHDSWLAALVSLARKGTLDFVQCIYLRDFASGLLVSGVKGMTTVCEALTAVGVTASSRELLWSLALRPISKVGADHDSIVAIEAIRALAANGGTPERDARFVQEAEAAWERGAWETLAWLVHEGARRGNEGVLPLAERVLAAAEQEPAAAAIAEDCMRALAHAGRIPSLRKWLAAKLAQPSSLLFPVAAALSRERPKPIVLEALRRALDDGARNGSAAAEAAEALVAVEALEVDDPRLDGILERAPDDARLRLVALLLEQGAPLASVRRHCVALLASHEEDVAMKMFTKLESSQDGAEVWDLMEAAMELGPTEAMRESIDHYLGAPSEAEMYWRELEDESWPALEVIS